MTKLQLPAEIVTQLQQKNQLYTLAFQLYTQLIIKCSSEHPAKQLAMDAIEFAKVFHLTVQEDMKNEALR